TVESCQPGAPSCARIVETGKPAGRPRGERRGDCGGGDVSGLTLSNAPMRPTRRQGGIRKWGHSALGAPLLLEIVIVVTLLLIYKAARLLAEGDMSIARWHAHQVIDFER